MSETLLAIALGVGEDGEPDSAPSPESPSPEGEFLRGDPFESSGHFGGSGLFEGDRFDDDALQPASA